jgi:hypothetical protein
MNFLHEAKILKQHGVVFKIDFEKAYDKVCWNFLFTCLQKSGFNSIVCGWIKSMVVGGTLCVKINNLLGKYFGTHKGVGQGDPLSPLLFNVIGDSLSRMFRKAKENNLV